MTKTTNYSIKMANIKDQGYGISPKLVTHNRQLSIESKAIYMYFSSYCGNGVEQAFPKLDTILHHLGISKNRYYKHLKPLMDLGYIDVDQRRKLNENGKWVSDSNLYILKQFIDTQVNNSDILHFEEHQNKDNNNRNNINKNISMYVGLYQSHLILTNSSKRFICDIHSKIDFDLFEKVLVEILNNNKIIKKDAYFIKTITALIEKNIKTISDYEISINEHKALLKKKSIKNINKDQIKKTKFHNFTETFTQYSEEEMDEIILKSQTAKFT